MDSVFLCYLWENKETATLSQHSLTDNTDEQKEQISFLHTKTLRDLKVIGWHRDPYIMKYNYKIFEEKAKKRAKNEYFEHPHKSFIIK